MASAPCGARTWRPFILDACCHAPHATYPDGGPETALRVAPRTVPIRSCSRWGLPCRSCCQSRGGLLPHPFTLAAPSPEGAGGRFAFCGTFPGVAPAGRYPAPCFHGARTFLTRSLSALAGAAARPAGSAYKGVRGAKRNRKSRTADLAIGCRRRRARVTLHLAAIGRATPGSCAWRHGRHCISGSCRRSCRRRAAAPCRDTSSRT